MNASRVLKDGSLNVRELTAARMSAAMLIVNDGAERRVRGTIVDVDSRFVHSASCPCHTSELDRVMDELGIGVTSPAQPFTGPHELEPQQYVEIGGPGLGYERIPVEHITKAVVF